MSLLGLIPTHQTRANTTDEYYLRKGAPITTPLVIASADGTHTSTLAVSNGGNLTISTDADSSPFNDMVLEPAGNLYLQPQKVAGFTQVGEGTEASGAILNIAGASGPARVYDSVYNKPPSYQSITTLIAPTSGNIAIDTTASLTAGVYQLQFFAETIAPTSATRLRMYATAPLSSAVINYSGASIAADANMAEANIISGYFTATAAGTYRFFVACSNLAAPWSAGEYGLQLVKLA